MPDAERRAMEGIQKKINGGRSKKDKGRNTMSRAGLLIFCTILLGVSMMAQPSPLKHSLDGEWRFRADAGKAGIDQRWYRQVLDRSSWETVATPDFWEAYPGMAKYDGWGWFMRTFQVESVAQPLSIHFAGVDDEAVVWVNGMEIGSHTGYSDPFTVDISSAVNKGENTIVVLVKDNGGGGGIYRPVTLIATAQLETLLRGPYSALPARESAEWVKDGAIYSVYLRSFSKEGTFTGLEQRLPELKRLGVKTLWLMPIHPVGVKHRKGSLGSPYAVQDYYGINPEFGTLADFRRLVHAVHALGLKVIIDLVANHTSWDSKLITEHPEWFTRDARGEMVPPNEDWADVADLDYHHDGLRRYMTDMMIWWVRDVGIDGFRCDVAEMVPTDFWESARAELDAIRPVMMLSEGSLPEHHVKAFDVTYSWNIYDVLEPLLSGKRPVALIDQILRTEELQFPRGSLRMRFTTNHDKNAWDAPAVKKFGPEGLQLATVLINTLPGVPMIYNGEEVANDRLLDLFEKVDIDWTRPRVVGDIYRALFDLRAQNSALSRGDLVRVTGTAANDVYAFLRTAGKQRIFVMLNFSAEPRRAKLQMPAVEGAVKGGTVKYREVFSGRTWMVSSSGGEVMLTVEGKGYRVFAAVLD